MAEPSNIVELFELREKVHQLELAIARLQEQKKAADAALVIADVALKHAQEVANEWRGSLDDQRSEFLTKIEAQGMMTSETQDRRALDGRVVVLEKASSVYVGGKSALDSVWVKAVGIAGVIGVVIGLLMRALKL